MALFSHDAEHLPADQINDAYIYSNNLIKQYLVFDSKEKMLFLLGTKGCGKTLLLRRKSMLYWNKLYNPTGKRKYTKKDGNELYEKLNFSVMTLTQSALQELQLLGTWKRIWRFALALFIVKKVKILLPKHLEWIDNHFGDVKSLNIILNRILRNPEKFLKSNFLVESGELEELVKDINSSFVYFVDQLDQALDDIVSNEYYAEMETKKGNSVPYIIWKHAQYAFLEASYNLIGINPHVRIYATAREEALNVKSPQLMNVRSFCTELNYTKAEIKQIIETNIRRVATDHLLGSSKDSLWYRFLGIENMEHISCINQDGSKYLESIFDVMYRHTYGRPREALIIGKNLYNKFVLPKGRVAGGSPEYQEDVRRIINDTANNTILDGYRSEFVPEYRKSLQEDCELIFSTNVIPAATVEDAKSLNNAAVEYLFRAGLLGFVENGYQRFVPVSVNNYNINLRFQTSDYYLIHPTLDLEMQSQHPWETYMDRYNSVGNGNRFNLPSPLSTPILASRELDYYLPRKTAGKSGDLWRIEPSLDELNKYLFKSKKNSEVLSKCHQRIREAQQMLSILFDVQVLEVLEEKFSVSFAERRDAELAKLKRLAKNSAYSKKIEKADETGILVYTDKFFGRIVLAGCLIFTDFDYPKINFLLRNFSDASGIDPELDRRRNLLAFLRHSFFIAHMKDYAPHSESERKAIFADLSEFEKEMLRDWFIRHVNHGLLVSNGISEEHRKYLSDLYLPEIKKRATNG